MELCMNGSSPSAKLFGFGEEAVTDNSVAKRNKGPQERTLIGSYEA